MGTTAHLPTCPKPAPRACRTRLPMSAAPCLSCCACVCPVRLTALAPSTRGGLGTFRLVGVKPNWHRRIPRHEYEATAGTTGEGTRRVVGGRAGAREGRAASLVAGLMTAHPARPPAPQAAAPSKRRTAGGASSTSSWVGTTAASPPSGSNGRAAGTPLRGSHLGRCKSLSSPGTCRAQSTPRTATPPSRGRASGRSLCRPTPCRICTRL